MMIGGRGAGTTSFRSPDLAKLASPLAWIGFLSCHLQSPLGSRGGVRGFLLNYSGVPMGKKRCAGKTASLPIVIGSTFCNRVEKKCFHKK